MKKHAIAQKKLSIDFPIEEYRYLKMACAKQDISIKDFVTRSIIQSVDAYEDELMLKRWDKDGTREEILKESKDPNRTVYKLNFDGDDLEEIKYSDL